ncbi:MAG: non-ribosomal peptide synthetase [Sphingomonas sp.]
MVELRAALSAAASSIGARVHAQALATPNAPAIEQGAVRLSYRELDERARSLAGALAATGVGSGSVVAVCLPRSTAQITALLAVLYAGAAYLPLDPAWPNARAASFIERAGCAAVVVEADRAVIAGATPIVAPGAAGQPIEPAAEAPLAYVIYTSGSTGEPKAVEIGHDNLAALVAWHRDAFVLDAGTRTSHLAGLGFDAAAWEIWPTLTAGGTLCLVDEATRLDPAALHDWLIGERIEIAFAPTALAQPLAAMSWPADTALRVLLTGAEKLTVRPKPGQPFAFVNNYGPTECTVVATSGVVSATDAGLPPIGRPIAGTTVHLLGEAGEVVPHGEAGEIHIGGAQVARGYRGDPEMTAQRFIEHPAHGRLYRTGDLARWLPSGELAFLGRVDGQVKVRGHRIEPSEIAAALNRFPAVTQSAVVLRGDELVAYIVPAQDGLAAATLREALAETLPDYMVPARFVALDALPLTPNGKVDAAALPDPIAHALPETPAGRGPESPTERRLFAIISEVIGRSDFGAEDDFFLIGGHSLLGTQVVVRSRDAFGVELTLFHLFEARSVAALAQVIEALIIEKLDSMSDEDIARMSVA